MIVEVAICHEVILSSANKAVKKYFSYGRYHSGGIEGGVGGFFVWNVTNELVVHNVHHINDPVCYAATVYPGTTILN